MCTPLTTHWLGSLRPGRCEFERPRHGGRGRPPALLLEYKVAVDAVPVAEKKASGNTALSHALKYMYAETDDS
jgi:hypothetical protein